MNMNMNKNNSNIDNNIITNDQNDNDNDNNSTHHNNEDKNYSLKFNDLEVNFSSNEDNHKNYEKEDSKDTDYENSHLNDTPSITSKIQRLDDMLEYCTLKHNYIINTNSIKKENKFHSHSNEEDGSTEKSYLHMIHDNIKNENSTSTSHSLSNLSSTIGPNPIFINNHLSPNYNSNNISKSSFLENSSNLTLTSDKDNNEDHYSIHSSTFMYSQNISGSEPLLKQSTFLKSDSINSSHTILQQDKDSDYTDFNNSMNDMNYNDE
eukprot:jgi/Orpsp1_1/1185836/evm.model.c7180000095544.1